MLKYKLKWLRCLWFMIVIISCSDQPTVSPKRLQIEKIEVKINELETKKDSILNPSLDF